MGTAMDLTANNSAESGGPELSGTPEQKKRNRIRFSCTSCRDKKLKCNRQSPCDQCEKRQLTDTCKFIPYVNPKPGSTATGRDAASTASAAAGPGAPRAKGPTSESAMQARLKHLEHLVQVLKSQKRDNADAAGAREGLTADDEPLPPPCKDIGKTAGFMVDAVRYVDGTNWESILDDITILTKDLKASVSEDTPEDGDYIVKQHPGQGPVLLMGGFPYATVLEMFAHLPPRMICDRLVARFFEIKEPGWMIFHIPSFLRAYDKFWADPASQSYTCVALLYIMMAHGALHCRGANEDVPGNLGPPLEVFETFKFRGAHCLALDDYTKPGKYKVETLILYFGCEYLQQNYTVLGTSVLFSMIVRLALHMGMHRDPKHYADMSAFEGEMRRRLWALLVELDSLVSFQFGLPSNIHSPLVDTEPPRNLHDADFEETTTSLPPSRPETERTVTTYTIVKSRLLSAFGAITSAISSPERFTFREFMRLDKNLEEAHKSFPDSLRHRSFSQSFVDPVDLIMQRYWLELLYQKSRTVLHREYMGAGRMDTRFAYSRKTCLEAATRTLQHQYDIHCELQPGGRLSKDRGLVSSLSIHDFLLADMILCLELSFLNAKANSPDASAQAVKAFATDTSTDIISREQIMSILQTSKSVWQAMRKDNAEANKGFKILSKMLTMSTGAVFESSPDSAASSSDFNKNESNYPPPFHFGADTGSSISSNAFDSARTGLTPQSGSNGSSPWTSSNLNAVANGLGQIAGAPWPTDQPIMDASDLPAQDIMDGLVEASLTGDWSLWDTQIHTATLEGCQIPWGNFFQSDPTDQT
ncbi:fungal-specific transcription factor domain-containing protein [Apodospora peruviana]|uniref:Fungal-specific transcription factor domain-containing protein n=1 Tax=Apodospora peruviana TaxID=516989 RepID=A0AAE0M0A8_9PEZI|nr:fungal-specific transcription factor domain-containing protein [Apodospora peruviana]